MQHDCIIDSMWLRLDMNGNINDINDDNNARYYKHSHTAVKDSWDLTVELGHIRLAKLAWQPYNVVVH